MLAANLTGPFRSSRCPAGANSAIYAVSSSLRSDHESDDVAIYHGGFWHSVTSADAYHEVSIDQPVTVRFEQLEGLKSESITLGPFAGIVIARGVIKTSGAKPRVLATFDEALEQWQAFDDGVSWPVVVIRDAN